MAEEKGGLVFHPMDQFIVKPLFGDGADWHVHGYEHDALACTGRDSAPSS